MRVSVSVAAHPGICSKCGAGSRGLGPVQVIPFTVVADGHAGEAEALCQGCLFDPEGAVAHIELENLAPGPAPRRKDLRRSKKLSGRLETSLAEDLNDALGEGVVVRQPGSGNMPWAKGDLRGKNIVRVEEKHTKAASFSLKLDELYKIASECAGREKPVFVVDFVDPGTSTLTDRYAVIPLEYLKELLHAPDQHR